MWVWSDELVDRVSGEDVNGLERVPLIACAVGSDADLHALAVELLRSIETVGATVQPADRGAVGR